MTRITTGAASKIAAARRTAAAAPCASRPYAAYANKKANAVWMPALARARFAPTSRALAAIAETQGEQARMNSKNATAEGALIAAARFSP